MKDSFRNDYDVIGYKPLLQEVMNKVTTTYVGYGFDEETLKLEQSVQKMLKSKSSIYLLTGGTQTNLLLISKVLNHYEGVIAVNTGHINVHETAAIEGAGYKIITVKGLNGKIRPYDIDKVMSEYLDCHMVKPGMVYISNSTEIGTIYNKEELKALYKTCKKYHLPLFLDGARLPIALTCLQNDMTIKDISDFTDAFYLGGTKNGLPYGEMLVIKDNKINQDFRFHLKNKGAMLSKTFALALLFQSYLKDDTYLKLAKISNNQAEYLRNNFKKLNLKLYYENPTNQIFLALTPKQEQQLQKKYDYEIWQTTPNEVIIRLVTSFHTTQTSCDALINDIKKLMN